MHVVTYHRIFKKVYRKKSCMLQITNNISMQEMYNIYILEQKTRLPKYQKMHSNPAGIDSTVAFY